MFKKKKPKEPEPQEEEETKVVNAKTDYNGENPPDEVPDLPEEPKSKDKGKKIPEHIKQALDDLMKYQGVYSVQDFPAPIHQIETLNIAFAAFAEMAKQTELLDKVLNELQWLRQDIKDLNE